MHQIAVRTVLTSALAALAMAGAFADTPTLQVNPETGETQAQFAQRTHVDDESKGVTPFDCP